MMSHLQSVLFALALTLTVAGWFFVKRMPGWFRSMRAAKWPLVESNVETVKVTPFTEQALAEVGYSFLVNGARYSGYLLRQFADEQDAWNYVHQMEGRTVMARYKPDDPSVSAVRSADQVLFSEQQPPLVPRLLEHVFFHATGTKPDLTNRKKQ